MYPKFTRGIPYVSKMWEERKVLIAEELAKGRYDIVSLQEVWCKYILFGKIDGRLQMYVYYNFNTSINELFLA